ncbi:M24 family metallopeptidase [Roseateles saccharophilus]|uniref:Xaa-Pro aminopeptidase/Xaa-Pro dipeptidase n=1 Tax=Roseateles saccharophilus TaxID=304 RepID=A0A4R3UCV1_ROSSA|nr:Xaa-Pro peptidase family protein [Roseateles saccharophilus]MDG0836115.1 aminopeptidase P family protein [Roseateles saccharophilus]TCU84966.1 Xaa-Pro aminopeptidase/Xaa-Pro dipeptidase [Roseateles saccharophilus]
MNSPLQPLFAARLERLRTHMAATGLDAALISAPEHLRYLFNYSGEAAFGIVGARTSSLVTDYRFIEQAEEECVHHPWRQGVTTEALCRDRQRERLGQTLGRVLAELGARAVGYEAAHVSVAQWADISADLTGLALRPLADVLVQARCVKDAWEQQQIAKAAALGDAALAALRPSIRLGVTERELANRLERLLQELGSEGLSFPTILGFGPRSALPHSAPSGRTLQRGDLIVLDYGAVVNGYRSDMTRSHVAGRAQPWQQRMHDTVARAQQAALALLQPGISGRALDVASAAVLAASEFAAHAGPGLGHGVGLILHEQPFLNGDCEALLQAGEIVTIEPGLYIRGQGGVRIEDDALLLDSGHQILTQAHRDFELAL